MSVQHVVPIHQADVEIFHSVMNNTNDIFCVHCANSIKAALIKVHRTALSTPVEFYNPSFMTDLNKCCIVSSWVMEKCTQIHNLHWYFSSISFFSELDFEAIKVM